MSDSVLILLAEDHPVNRKVALLLLNRFGYRAEAVDNGLQAVEAAKTGKYSLILMDVMMPDFDGLEATRLIRRWEQTSGRHIPILALTALAMVGDKERCLAAGMDDYITKPIDPVLMRDKIEEWLKKSDPEVANTTNHSIDIDQLRNAYGEEEVQELLDLFLNVTTTLIGELEIQIQEGNCAAIERLAHELKGSSAAIYARMLSTYCAQMEEAARHQNHQQISSLLPQITQAFANLKQSLSHTQDSG